MFIKSAEIYNRHLILDVPVEQAGAFINSFKAGEYKVTKVNRKRSLSQNAYAWVLINKIAEVMHLSPSVVYQGAIKDIGGVSDVVGVRNEAVNKFCESWAAKGLGWQTEVINQSDGYTDLMVYYGSSTFDSKQMTALIESLIQEAKALDIETLTPDELERLK